MKFLDINTDKIICYTENGMITILENHENIVFYCKKIIIENKSLDIKGLCMFKNGTLNILED